MANDKYVSCTSIKNHIYNALFTSDEVMDIIGDPDGKIFPFLKFIGTVEDDRTLIGMGVNMNGESRNQLTNVTVIISIYMAENNMMSEDSIHTNLDLLAECIIEKLDRTSGQFATELRLQSNKEYSTSDDTGRYIRELRFSVKVDISKSGCD